MVSVSELSPIQKKMYFKELAKMSESERRENRRSATQELIDEGYSPTEAITILDGEEQLFREYLRDEKLRQREGKRIGGNILSERIRRPYDEPEFLEYEKPEDIDDVEIEEEPEKTPTEQYEELKGKISKGVEKGKEIITGAVGLGSREPIKEAAISAGAKVIQALKPKQLTKEEKKSQARIKRAYEEARIRGIERGARETGYRKGAGLEQREPSLRDLGKGSLQAERYEPKTPDFFGSGSGFDLGVRSPMGEPEKERIVRPPSTVIPFGGTKPPSTSIPFGGSRAPETRIPIGGTKPPSTHVKYRKHPPETKTYVNLPRTKTYVKIPKGVKAKKPVKVSTKIPPPKKEDAVKALGLEGYW